MLEIGSIVDGKYKILNVVGKGGMSVVYLAMNERANKQWAIKEVRKDGMQDFEVVKQNLIVETDLLKRLNHPHLPSIIDVIDGEGTFLIVMDYIEGIPLSKALKESGAQSQEDVIEWAKQLCDVLGYLHSRKPPIIYRDMKPSNVMLKPDGNVTLIDFGTAREFKSESVEDTKCLGTQGYAAPEQYGGHGQTDARTDIYCLGATMYHLVTGHNPATPPYEMYPIRQWNPMLSSGLEEIILKCTQRNPNDRYQSCAELLYALDHFRDLDIENKKVQSLKWKTFLASTILTIIMLIGSIGFGAALNVQTASTYESYIQQAQTSISQEDAVDNYLKAIEVKPEDPSAYEKMLEMFKDDNELTTDEYDTLKEVIYENEDAITSAYPTEYAENIAYELGQALYFIYNTSSSSNNSSSGIVASAQWFEKAKSGASDSKIQERSQLLYNMASDYKYLPSMGASNATDSNGDLKITASEYWNELVELASSDLAETENAKIALLVYRSVLSDMCVHSDWFTDSDGVSDEEFISEINTIKSYVAAVPNTANSGYSSSLESLIEDCNRNAEEAINSINASGSTGDDNE